MPEGLIGALAIVLGAAALGALMRCLPHYPRGPEWARDGRPHWRIRREPLYDTEALGGGGTPIPINLFQSFGKFLPPGMEIQPLPPPRRLEAREGAWWLIEEHVDRFGPQCPPPVVSEVRGDFHDEQRGTKTYALVKRPDGRREFVDVTKEVKPIRRARGSLVACVAIGAFAALAYMAVRGKSTANT